MKILRDYFRRLAEEREAQQRAELDEAINNSLLGAFGIDTENAPFNEASNILADFMKERGGILKPVNQRRGSAFGKGKIQTGRKNTGGLGVAQTILTGKGAQNQTSRSRNLQIEANERRAAEAAAAERRAIQNQIDTLQRGFQSLATNGVRVDIDKAPGGPNVRQQFEPGMRMRMPGGSGLTYEEHYFQQMRDLRGQLNQLGGGSLTSNPSSGGKNGPGYIKTGQKTGQKPTQFFDTPRSRTIRHSVRVPNSRGIPR